MILRGLFLMARGAKSGIKEFDNSMDAFTASLAPLIAFPLVGAGVSALGGQWQLALIGLSVASVRGAGIAPDHP